MGLIRRHNDVTVLHRSKHRGLSASKCYWLHWATKLDI